MDRVRLLQLRDELSAEHDDLAETLSAVEAALEGVEALLARLAPESLPPQEMPVETPVRPVRHRGMRPRRGSHPRGAEAVEAILTETGSWMTYKELAAAQLERGWPPESGDPESAVRAAANRLVASKPHQFVREHGRYRYLADPDQRPPVISSEFDSVKTRWSVPSTATDEDWRNLPRTEAVAMMLWKIGKPLGPSELSRALHEVGRDDSPLAVGKALDHLQGKQRAKTIGRAMWVLTDQDDDDAQGVLSVPDQAREEEEVTDDQEGSGAAPAFTGGEQRS